MKPWWILVLASLLGCGARTTFFDPADLPDGSPPPDSPPCPLGQTSCGGRCTTTSLDPSNCGVCGRVCQPGESCQGGACAGRCAPGQVLCGAVCADLSSNPSHCGSCGRTCPTGLCRGGVCDTTDCGAGRLRCGAVCVSPFTDPSNCGACGRRCPDFASCRAGTCVAECGPPLTSCGLECVSTVSDPRHCGGCNRPCPPGVACQFGSCMMTACPAPFTNCSGRCVALQNDVTNCGACNRRCATGQSCVAGACQTFCTPPLTACGAVCTNLASDSANCGLCGRVCGPGFACVLGGCTLRPRPPPPAGPTFQVNNLGTTRCQTLEHNMATGDDRGGLAWGNRGVFYTGDDATARFDLTSLTPATLRFRHDSLVSDLRSGTVYVLSQGGAPITMMGGLVDSLSEVEPFSGATTPRLRLSMPFPVSPNAGIFSGYGRVGVHDGRSTFYDVDTVTGVVTPYGAVPVPSHTSCESWAYWGVLENTRGQLWMTYVQNSTTIARTSVFDLTTEPVSRFTNLSDMCSFSVAPSMGRWYFHHEGTSQFRSGDETLGFCDASLSTTTTTAGRYSVEPAPPEVTFVDACTAPGVETILRRVDDRAENLRLPFAFTFWGTTLPLGSPVTVSSNGWLSLVVSMDSLGGRIPDVNPPNGTLALHWGDNMTRDNGVCFTVLGAPPRRQWVVEWSDQHYCCTDDPGIHLTFEAVLTEGTNTIDYLYQDLRGVRPQTVGLENPDGTDGIALCTAGMDCPITAGVRLRFTPR